MDIRNNEETAIRNNVIFVYFNSVDVAFSLESKSLINEVVRS